MSGFRPEGPAAASDGRAEGLGTPAEAMSNTEKEGNEPPSKLIPAAC